MTVVSGSLSTARMPVTGPRPQWPWPHVVAHRGAGLLAPENTMAAFNTGARLGHRMFEFDVKLSRDAVPYCLHDATLERTTDGHGPLAELAWDELARLDAGRWRDARFAGERLPGLDQVWEFLQSRGLWANIEIKPVPGDEMRTGETIGRWVAERLRGRADTPRPVITSFSPVALAASMAQAPDVVHGLLLDAWREDWAAALQTLGCDLVVFNHRVLTHPRVMAIAASGTRLMCYTVNDPARASDLLQWGVNAVITDAVDRIGPSFVPVVA